MSGTLVVPDLPFHIGPSSSSKNPGELPATLPFEIGYDPVRNLLVQTYSDDLDEMLSQAYKLGLELGTPLADDDLGRPYVDDIINAIAKHARPPGRALEIGAGVGYTSWRLKQAGWDVDSLEPGVGYEAQWRRYGIEVINEFFPTAQAPGPYDLIVNYAVLEHIAQPEQFLRSIREHLAPTGILALSVPDCENEIVAGDPAILIHEHINYFESQTLQALLERCGFAVDVAKSGFGRSLYAFCRPVEGGADDEARLDTQHLTTYADRCSKVIQAQREFIFTLASRGTVGIYCPARALAVLPQDLEVRLFDDGAGWRGRYIPPFTSRIESRRELLDRPLDSLVIMSRTFGRRLKEEIMNAGGASQIYLPDDMIAVTADEAALGKNKK